MKLDISWLQAKLILGAIDVANSEGIYGFHIPMDATGDSMLKELAEAEADLIKRLASAYPDLKGLCNGTA